MALAPFTVLMVLRHSETDKVLLVTAESTERYDSIADATDHIALLVSHYGHEEREFEIRDAAGEYVAWELPESNRNAFARFDD
jgi:hypothetical protein